MSKSQIEWTGKVWNPITGCNKISQGCKNCYAEKMSKRLKAMGQHKYRNEFKLTLHENEIEKPKLWKKGQTIFVNSMSDLFHEDVPLVFIQKVFITMNETPQHTYQILTKRSARLREISHYLNWTENIWMGVSVESEEVTERIYDLSETGAKTKFLSCEPLLGPLPNMELHYIDWVIVGGESGSGSRPMEKEWVVDIKNQCENQAVPFFFKQWGGVNKKKTGRLLDGVEYNGYPTPENYVDPQAKLDMQTYYPLLTNENSEQIIPLINEIIDYLNLRPEAYYPYSRHDGMIEGAIFFYSVDDLHNFENELKVRNINVPIWKKVTPTTIKENPDGLVTLVTDDTTVSQHSN